MTSTKKTNLYPAQIRFRQAEWSAMPFVCQTCNGSAILEGLDPCMETGIGNVNLSLSCEILVDFWASHKAERQFARIKGC